ncbi:MAG TPA: PBP1A family penicillin-binding protein [Pseudogracilibacillus sp.]|nr:PBP1A family penicillin-binding protein [Pseudogracilibacillus sp.]
MFYIKKAFYTLLFFIIILIVSLSIILSFGPPSIQLESNVFLDDNNHVIHDENIQYDQLPKQLIQATIAAEDKQFFKHHGFDFKGIGRALFKNIIHRQKKEGASTITQQLAKNLYLSNDKTWKRKIKEAIYTIRLEYFYDKEEIFAAYIQSIYYGHGVYGIGHASQFYFQKSIDDLKLHEMALLTGIPKGPSYYSPLINEVRAHERKSYILHEMMTEGYISEQQYEAHRHKKVHLVASHDKRNQAAYFLQTAKEEVSAILSKQNHHIDGPFFIYTTLDQSLQDKMQLALANNKVNQDIQVASIALKPKDGAIKALIGGVDFQQSEFNRAIHSERMVGSTIKPLLYYNALENGFTQSTMLMSEPTTFQLNQDEAYSPNNFMELYAHKPITLAQALALSDNMYAVKTLFYISIPQFIQTLHQFQLKQSFDDNPTIALGSSTASLKDMTNAYNMIASDGHQTEPYTIRKITDQDGKTVYERKHVENRIFSKENIFLLRTLMTNMFNPVYNDYVSITGMSIHHKMPDHIAGKSGTTDYDSWMIGFSDDMTLGVWSGYDDMTPLTSSDELQLAKQMWSDVVQLAHLQASQLNQPEGIIKKEIDIKTGKIATEDCQHTATMYFKKGTEPKQTCLTHKKESNQDKTNHPLWQRFINFMKKLL